mmetsp:Transcript_23039/g.35560  ORF Transcript_23039/g.35560 Transcript_23039/m.35560 type:complete len:207 (+) Transcript_23039:2157-2777(+)
MTSRPFFASSSVVFGMSDAEDDDSAVMGFAFKQFNSTLLNLRIATPQSPLHFADVRKFMLRSSIPVISTDLRLIVIVFFRPKILRSIFLEFEFLSAFADIFRPNHAPSNNGLLEKGVIVSTTDLEPIHFNNRNFGFFTAKAAILVLITVLRFVGEKYFVNDGVPLALAGGDRGAVDLRLIPGMMQCFYRLVFVCPNAAEVKMCDSC